LTEPEGVVGASGSTGTATSTGAVAVATIISREEK
jgi:hypothetical protein